MKRTFGVGLLVAVIGGVGLFIAGMLGLTLTDTMIGVGAGAIAGLVHFGTPLQRLGGFLIGFVLGVFFVAMLLGLIPGGGSFAGVTVALATVLIIIALVHGFSGARIHAWSMLLGVLCFAAGVYPTLSANPLAAYGQLWTFVGTQLAMAMIGFLVVIPATIWPDKTSLEQQRKQPKAPTPPDDEAPVAVPQQATEPVNSASIDEIIGGTR